MFLYIEYKRLPSLSISASFVVVDPASIPIKQSPEKSFKDFLLTFDVECLCLKASYSASIEKSGGKGFVVVSCEFFKTMILLFNFSTEIGFLFKESKAAPLATKRCASDGVIVSSGDTCSVSINLFLSSDR